MRRLYLSARNPLKGFWYDNWFCLMKARVVWGVRAAFTWITTTVSRDSQSLDEAHDSIHLRRHSRARAVTSHACRYNYIPNFFMNQIFPFLRCQFTTTCLQIYTMSRVGSIEIRRSRIRGPGERPHALLMRCWGGMRGHRYCRSVFQYSKHCRRHHTALPSSSKSLSDIMDGKKRDLENYPARFWGRLAASHKLHIPPSVSLRIKNS